MSSENSELGSAAMWVQMERQSKEGNSPDKPPVLQLLQFTPTPKVSFGNVKLGQLKSMLISVHNPQDIVQELKVHKFPKSEEFSIDCLHLSVEPGQSKPLAITWRPVTEGNRRELFVFVTNNNFRTHVVLLGTAVLDKSVKKKKVPLSSIHNRPNSPPRKILSNRTDGLNRIGNQPRTRIRSPASHPAPTVQVSAATGLINAATASVPTVDTFPADASPCPRQSVTRKNGRNAPLLNRSPTDETFVLVSHGDAMPECRVPSTPERRQTYVKERGADERIDTTIEEDGDEEEEAEAQAVPHLADIICSFPQPGVVTDEAAFSFEDSAALLNATVEVDDLPPSQIRRCSTGIKNHQPPLNMTASMTPIHAKVSLFKDLAVATPLVNAATFLVTPSARRRQPAPSGDGLLDITGIGVLAEDDEDVEAGAKPGIQKRKSQTGSRSCQHPVGLGRSEGSSRFRSSSRLLKRSCPLTLIKPVKTDIPRHPNPFVTSNTFYDNNWMQKQERGFKQWLNYMFTPSLVDDAHPVMGSPVSPSADVWSAKDCYKSVPNREQVSAQTYREGRQMNRLRRSAVQLFNSPAIVDVLLRIEKEVDVQRLAIRKDRALHLDIGMKHKLLQLLSAYNVLWLRIAFETVFGEVLPRQSLENDSYVQKLLMKRMMNNENIKLQYAHSSVPNLTRPGYELALKKFILKKFIFLVLFLDKAKQERLIQHDPCLFNKKQDIKSTKAVLLEFSRNYLSGEGDITKHLAHLGFVAAHQQGPLDELEFTVANIAVDLRDGTRLARVLELLLRDWSVVRSLRVPAVTFHQKVHNVNVVLRTLECNGAPLAAVAARDIVDGHREKTLALLWHVILHFQVNVTLKVDRLQSEVARLCEALRRTGVDVQALLRIDDGDRSTICKDNDRLEWLLRWCRCVCSHHGLEVNNFSVSFSDGRALCSLLHHYHPRLLAAEEIRQETTQSRHQLNHSHSDRASLNDSFEANWTMSFDSAEGVRTASKQLLTNEKDNFALFISRVSLLGGIPDLFAAGDLVNTIPNEKNIIIYLTYLCTRIMEEVDEIHAATLIQKSWRSYRVRKLKKMKKLALGGTPQRRRNFEMKLSTAAITIQRFVRHQWKRRQDVRIAASTVTCQAAIRRYLIRKRFLRLRSAAIMVQSQFRFRQQHKEYLSLRSSCVGLQAAARGFIVRRRCENLRREQNSAAATIQSWWRRCIAVRQERLRMEQAATLIQRSWRAEVARRKVVRSVVFVQQVWRGNRLANKFRYQYLARRAAALVVQSHWRGRQTRKHLSMMVWSALTIQKHYRARVQGIQTRHRLTKLSTVATVLQAHYRGWRDRRLCLRKKNAIITIQGWWKGFLRRRESAVTVIQRFWRGYRAMTAERQQLLLIKYAAVTFQSQWRGRKTRIQLKLMNVAVIRVQKWYRLLRLGQAEQSQFLKMKSSVILIQRQWRHALSRSRRQKKEETATITIQRYWRGHHLMKLVQQQFQHSRSAAVTIQRHWRGHRLMKLERQQFQHSRSAAVTIQQYWRGHRLMKLERQQFQHSRSAAVTIQRHWRGHRLMKLERQQFQHSRSAAVTIQQYWRGHRLMKLDQQQFHHYQSAAVAIQRHWRGHRLMKLDQQQFQRSRSAAVTIQQHWRGHLLMKLDQQQFHHYRSAAVTIQRHWRGHRLMKLDQQQFQHSRSAAVTIQQHWRGHRLMKLDQQQFQRSRSAAVTIQQHWRGHLLMKLDQQQFQRSRSAAVTIQRHWRGHRLMKLDQQQFQRSRSAAVTIQRHWRGHCLMKLDQQQFQRSRSAAVAIQRHWRGHRLMKLDQQQFQHSRSAAVAIQRHWRGHRLMKLDQQQFQSSRSAAVTIQRHWRGHCLMKLDQQQFQRSRSAAVAIQRHWRGHCLMKLDQQQFQSSRSAAVTIQRYWRGHRLMKLDQQQFQSSRSAAVTIQRHWRGHRLMKLERKQFQRSRSAAVAIQRHWRGHRLMKLDQQQFQSSRSAAVAIQRHWRGHRLMKLDRQQFQSSRSAAVTIQRHWRGHRLMKLDQQQFQSSRSAAVTIQRYWRGHCLMKLDQQQFQRSRSAAVAIQRHWRGHRLMKLVRKQFQRSRSAAVAIQRHWRGHRLMKLDQQQFQSSRSAAVTIQRHWRGHRLMKLDQQQFQSSRSAAVTIQRHWRGHRLMKLDRQQFIHTKLAALAIQAHWRSHQTRVLLEQKNRAASVIQIWYRSSIESGNVRQVFLENKNAALAIQRWWRQVSHRRMREKAAITIQQFWRGHCQMNFERQQFSKLRRVTVLIQSRVRGHLIRIRRRKVEYAVRSIQQRFRAKCRGDAVRRQALQSRNAVVTIQRWYRRTTVRRRLAAANVIQRWWREITSERVLELAEFERRRHSAITIQKAFRCRSERNKFLRTKCAAVVIQRWWRSTGLLHDDFGSENRTSTRSSTAVSDEPNTSAEVPQQAGDNGFVVSSNSSGEREAASEGCLARSTGCSGEPRYSDGISSPGSDVGSSVELCEVSSTSSSLSAGRMSEDRAATIIQAFWRGHIVRCAYANTSLTKVRSCIQRANACANENVDNRLGNRTCSSLQYLLECRSQYHILCAMQHLMASSANSEICCQKIVDGNALDTIVKLIDNSNRSVSHIKLVYYCVSVLLNISKCAYNATVIWETERLVEVLCNVMNIYHNKEKDIFSKCCSLLWNLSQDAEIKTALQTDVSFLKKLQTWYKNVSKKDRTPKGHAPIRHGSQILCLPIQPDWVLGKCHLREFRNSLVAVNSLMYILKLKTEP